MHKTTPKNSDSGKSTECKHEWYITALKNGEPFAMCKHCELILVPYRIDAILNDYDRLKRATDALTAEDADNVRMIIALCIGWLMENNRAMAHECMNLLENYANILSEEE